MRGLGGIRGLVMLDGVPINDPSFGYVQVEPRAHGERRARRVKWTPKMGPEA